MIYKCSECGHELQATTRPDSPGVVFIPPHVCAPPVPLVRKPVQAKNRVEGYKNDKTHEPVTNTAPESIKKFIEKQKS